MTVVSAELASAAAVRARSLSVARAAAAAGGLAAFPRSPDDPRCAVGQDQQPGDDQDDDD
jgi:hypothetical protein